MKRVWYYRRGEGYYIITGFSSRRADGRLLLYYSVPDWYADEEEFALIVGDDEAVEA